MSEIVDLVVIGAGQAGLSLSYELSRAGVEHVVLERGRVGESWRGRWDSFCLVTPNWSMQLPAALASSDPSRASDLRTVDKGAKRSVLDRLLHRT